MASLLGKLNKAYKADETRMTGAKRTKLSAIEKLQRFKEKEGSDDIFEIFVDYSDSDTGDLLHYDNLNICYVIPADEIKKLYPNYVPRGNSYLLGTEFKVKVKSVDVDKEVVEFIAIENTQVSAKQYTKRASNMYTYSSEGEALRNYLMNAINMDIRKPLVRGTVINVEEDRIFIDLFDKGVEAVIPVKNYSIDHKRDLREEVRVGDSVKGVLFAYRARPNEIDKHFLVSTIGYIPDPWMSERVRNIKPKDIVVVKCVEKPEKERALYFWGTSRVIKGIDILCDYTTKVPAAAVKVGHFYKCKVAKIDHEKHKITVSPFEECKSYDAGETL